MPQSQQKTAIQEKSVLLDLASDTSKIAQVFPMMTRMVLPATTKVRLSNPCRFRSLSNSNNLHPSSRSCRCRSQSRRSSFRKPKARTFEDSPSTKLSLRGLPRNILRRSF
ncbi:hypothetical protein L596_002162 [Steinernema carpocapsae]|uniref:Uncharacterized protein n=1 Tax=Steinernema carpocapsae TaxID=34508 RepID=A0A4U8UR23_STECR|nr:hypothetical protein L596_002162 [Steinernema carpocapsae]